MNFLDLIFPKFCVNCGKFGQYVCNKCQIGLWEEEQICPSCRRLSLYGQKHEYCKDKYSLDGLICLWAYEGMAKKIIQKAKYSSQYDLLKSLISNFDFSKNTSMSQFLEFINKKPIVTEVPLHKNRLLERGFNQSEIIAKNLADVWKLNYQELLIRKIDTSHQVGKSREKRLLAMDGVFEVIEKRSDNILLVDDVWTTGATMMECCKVLKKKSTIKVWGLVLAR